MGKVMILGARGMLGHKLCQLLPESGHQVLAVVRQSPGELERFPEIFGKVEIMGGLDVLDDSALARAIGEAQPDFIVNAVGIVKQLAEANNALLSVGINSYLPHKLARLADRHGAKVIHISTDCIFSGAVGSYTEDSPSDATDMYGKSKFLGETDKTETAAVTLRTSFIGREIHKPTHGLVEWFLSQQGRTTGGFTRAIYTGLTSFELVNVIEKIISTGSEVFGRGTLQVASEPINKYDLLCLIRDICKLDIKIEPTDEFFCDRSMVMKSFTEAIGYKTPSWEKMIRKMNEDIQKIPYEKYLST